MSGTDEPIPFENARDIKKGAPAEKPAPFVPLALADSAQRKKMPLTTGVLDYFGDALSLVAYISYLGNNKHNPGEPLHWSRGKSDDHDDCITRHMLNRYGTDADGILEIGEMMWRALAAGQLLIEKKYGITPRKTPANPTS